MITSKRSGKQARLAVQSDILQKGDSFLSSLKERKRRGKD